MQKFFLYLLLLAAVSDAQGTLPTLEERREGIEQMDADVSPEALDRKSRSEAILKLQGVPINNWLPVIEAEEEAKKRTVEEIAYRALALLTVAVKGEGLEQSTVERIVADYGLENYFTPKERAFIEQEFPLESDRVNFSWRYEAAWTLLWALGYVDDLGVPDSYCDVGRAVRFMKERTPEQFIADAKLRPLSEILDQADLIYRYNWAVVDARVNGKPAPAGLDPGVTYERHYALNWLIGYMNQAWDDISTDT